MSSRKPNHPAAPTISPAMDFATRAGDAKRLLAKRLARAGQVVAVVEMDGPFSLFAGVGADSAATLQEGLHRRLASICDVAVAIGAFRFLLLNDAPSVDEARRIVRSAIESAADPFLIDGRAMVLVAVAGAMFARRDDDAVITLDRTAATLNEARRRGRRLLMAHEFQAASIDPLSLAGEVETLSQALGNKRLRLALQPVVNALTHEVEHHEALLRVLDDDGVARSAAPLIATSETLDIAYRIDFAALDLATSTLKTHPTLRLAVNISAASARDTAHAQGWLDRMAMLGDATERLTVEMTETAAPDDIAGAVSDFASSVRELGARFSIDDFGSGYTSYRNLLALRPDEVKIDGCFVTALQHDPRSAVLVRTLVAMAHELGARTVGEWVESAEDAAALTALGVDALQGNYFGDPQIDWQSEPARLDI